MVGAGGVHTPRKVCRRDVGKAKRFCNAWRDERRILNRGQPEEHHTGLVFVGKAAYDLCRQPRLTDASRSHERDQSNRAIGQPTSQYLYVVVTSEKRGQRDWQGRATELVNRGVLNRRACASK